jgi:hypothetical protein
MKLYPIAAPPRKWTGISIQGNIKYIFNPTDKIACKIKTNIGNLNIDNKVFIN